MGGGGLFTAWFSKSKSLKLFVFFLNMPIKSKVFIETLQKSPNRHNISFTHEFNNKNTKCHDSFGLTPRHY